MSAPVKNTKKFLFKERACWTGMLVSSEDLVLISTTSSTQQHNQN